MTDTTKQDPHAELMRLADVYAGPEMDSICLERKSLADFARTLTDHIAELEAQNLELERLCEKTYVAQGADAYHYACECLEEWQAKRATSGKEVGTQLSLCDGMGWVYRRLDALEAQLEAVGAGGMGAMIPAAPQARELSDDEIIMAMNATPHVATSCAGWVSDQRIAWGRAVLLAARSEP